MNRLEELIAHYPQLDPGEMVILTEIYNKYRCPVCGDRYCTCPESLDNQGITVVEPIESL